MDTNRHKFLEALTRDLKLSRCPIPSPLTLATLPSMSPILLLHCADATDFDCFEDQRETVTSTRDACGTQISVDSWLMSCAAPRIRRHCALSEMLTVSELSKSFAGRALFDDVSLQVNRGDRIGLVGPNGAGKS